MTCLTETMSGEPPLPENSRWHLTSGQLGIWGHQRLHPESLIDNASECLEIHDDLDVKVFEAALRRVVAEVDAFHLRFYDDDGEVRQYVDKPRYRPTARRWLSSWLVTTPRCGRTSHRNSMSGSGSLTPGTASRRMDVAMDSEEIRQAIASFPRWHYQFDLRGEVTPIWRQDQVNRHDQRARYFFDPLVEFFGGSLKGKRVLDLGCNAGFWALRAAQAACGYVVGVDARQTHIDQASLVFEVNEIPPDRYEFICGDIFSLDYARLGTFDIVLCLGLIYHISKPMELLELVARANTDVLVIDTGLSMAEGPYLELGYESNESQANGVGGSLVFYPTALAMMAMVRQFGYSIRIVKPDFSDYTGCRDYKNGQRRAFVAVKGADRLSPPFDFEDAVTLPGQS